MTTASHPRPNPIVAAMYTLRDLDIEVIVIHGPSGCSFMASRALEDAGVRIVTSGMDENDLIFGGAATLEKTIKAAYDRFKPGSMAVVGTCSSMIIGDDIGSAVKRAGVDCNIIAVNCHGCMGSNTSGAIAALNATRDAGMIGPEELQRQIFLLEAATSMESTVGLSSKAYLQPSHGTNKVQACRRMIEVLSSGGRIACVMLAKKELAFRFSDMFLALDEARIRYGGTVVNIANLDPGVGLPRIRGYAERIIRELDQKGVVIDHTIGGLDEYAVCGDAARKVVDELDPDLLVIVGIPHCYPRIRPEDILISDQPRQISNYLQNGCVHVLGELDSHALVMGASSIVRSETGDVLRGLME